MIQLFDRYRTKPNAKRMVRLDVSKFEQFRWSGCLWDRSVDVGRWRISAGSLCSRMICWSACPFRSRLNSFMKVRYFCFLRHRVRSLNQAHFTKFWVDTVTMDIFTKSGKLNHSFGYYSYHGFYYLSYLYFAKLLVNMVTIFIITRSMYLLPSFEFWPNQGVFYQAFGLYGNHGYL